MSGLVGSVASQLSQVLSIAGWRGVTFHMVSSNDSAGRRLVKFLFPGRDDAVFEDLGALQGPLQISGLIVGADYLVRANRMRQAFLAAGPATLVHPWWGSLRCVLTQPGEIEFSDVELGIARFTATFERAPLPTPAAIDTLGALLDRCDAMLDSAELMLEQALAPLRLPLALVTSLGSLLNQAAGYWDIAMGNVPEDVSTAAQPGITALQAGTAAPTYNAGNTFADQVSALLAAVPAAIAGIVSTGASSAIGPGGSSSSSSTSTGTMSTTTSTSAVDPRQVTTVLLAVGVQIGALAASPVTGTAAGSDTAISASTLALAAQGQIIAQAVATASSITYTSQQDALSWRTTMDTAVASYATAITALGPNAPQAVATMWQAAQETRAAIAADISADLGRLPAVRTITTGRPMSAWLIALHLAGDTPSTMVAALQDVVTRNAISNPAVVPAGDLEVLQ